jgi:O-antigen ligase
MILSRYPSYRWPEAPNPQAPHLHNNVLQMAAERGVPGLAFFAWWALLTCLVAAREARRAEHDESPVAAGVLAAIVAVFAAGLFEYNLGDSEVLMLVLLLDAVPFAMARERAARLAAA